MGSDKCEGLPNSDPCPDNARGPGVEYRICDRWLCQSCFRVRFPVDSEGTEPSKVDKLTTLADIELRKHDPNLVTLFTSSLENIFLYAQGDIKESLSKLEPPRLNDIRKELSSMCINMFDEFKDSSCIKRNAKHKMVDDIMSLGACVANKRPTKELKKILKNRSDPPDHTIPESQPQAVDTQGAGDVYELLQQILDGHDITEFLKQVIDSRERIAKLEKQVHTLTQLVMRTEHDTSSSESDSETSDSEKSSGSEASESDSENVGRSSADRELYMNSGTVGDGSGNGDINRLSRESECLESDSDHEADVDPSSFSLTKWQKRKLARKRRKMKKTNESTSSTIPGAGKAERKNGLARSELKAAPKQGLKTKGPKRAANVEKRKASNDSGLKAATKPIYVGGVDANTVPSTIKNHLNSIGVNGVFDIKPLSRDRDRKSFKVDISANEFGLACATENWPKGITVRPFRTRPHGPRSRGQGSFKADKRQPRQKHDWWKRRRDENGGFGNVEPDYSGRPFGGQL